MNARGIAMLMVTSSLILLHVCVQVCASACVCLRERHRHVDGHFVVDLAACVCVRV